MWHKKQNTNKSVTKISSLVVMFFILVIFGLIMLASASAVIGYTNFGDNYYYFKHQLINGLIPGLFLFFLCSKISYQFWQRNAWKIFITSLVLLTLVFVPGLGVQYNNAKSWLVIAGFSIQPSEIAKLALIIFLAAWLSKSKDQIRTFKYGLLPFLLFLGLVATLIALQPDMGTLLVVVAIAVTVFFTAGANIKHILGLLLVGGAALGGLAISAPYRLNRLLAFINPEKDAQGIGYHIIQALLAVGSGGLWGLGFGKSRQKFAYLPEIQGDSIFAVMAEELGFVVSTLFIILLFIFIIKIIRTANKEKDHFAKFFAIGLATWLAWQSIFNISAMIGLLPLTGVPLPLISYGGTSLMILMAAMGIMVNISKKHE